MLAAVALLAAPTPAEACGLFGIFNCPEKPEPATYAPPFVSAYATTTYASYAPYAPSACATCPTPTSAAPACSSCATQTTFYTPITAYRTEVRRVPVTTYHPTVGYAPSSSCPVTTYRPVTAWSTQRVQIPYTTYRIGYASPCTPCATYTPAACNPCGDYGTCGVPTASVGSGCSSCGVPVVSDSYGGPSDQTQGETFAKKPVEQTVEKPVEKPVNDDASEGTGEEKKADEEPLEPIPAEEPVGGPQLQSYPVPKLLNPNDRTTSRPIVQATYLRMVSAAADAAPAARSPQTPKPAGEIGVWRASHD